MLDQQNLEYFSINAGGTHENHRALNGYSAVCER